MTPVVGVRAVLEALRAGRRRVHRVWLAGGRKADPLTSAIEAEAGRRRVPVVRIDRDQLTRRAGGPAHQGVVAEASELPDLGLTDLGEPLAADALLIVLDGVQDPNNLGAIVRTAAAARALAVILPRDRAVAMTPAAVKVAEGAAEHVPVITVTNLKRALGELRAAGAWLFAFDAAGERACWELDLGGPVALVLGSEGRGIRRLVRESCDYAARIPLDGTGSINVAAAAAVAVYEVTRQRARSPGSTGLA